MKPQNVYEKVINEIPSEDRRFAPPYQDVMRQFIYEIEIPNNKDFCEDAKEILRELKSWVKTQTLMNKKYHYKIFNKKI